MRAFFPLLCLLLLLPAWAGEGSITPGRPNRLNISILFEYDESDLEGWKTNLTEASRFLYEFTERQFALGNVTFYVNQPAQKELVDVQILPNSDLADADYPTLEDRTLGVRGKVVRYGQQLRNRALVPGSTSSGPAVMGHELGHYVFGMADEYRAKSVNKPFQEGVPAYERGTQFDFCTQPNNNGVACVMEDSGDTELCTHLADPQFKHNNGWFLLPMPEADSDGIVRPRYYQNDQEAENKKDCWNYLADICRVAYGLNVTVPTSAPVANTEGFVAPNFLVPDKSVLARGLVPGLRVALVLDNSTNVEALRAAAATVTADEIVYITSAGVVPNLTNLTTGAFNANTALTLANGQLANGPQTGAEVIVYLTAAATPLTFPTDYPVYVAGLGTAPFSSWLALADDTGGLARAATTPTELTGNVQSLTAEAQGFQSLGSSPTFTVEPSTTELRVLGATSLTDPQGNTVGTSVSAPLPGAWRAHGPGPLDVLVQTSDLDAVFQPTTTVANYPTLLPFAVEVEYRGFAVLGADVQAQVRRPDGSVANLRLFDDGQAAHDDEFAGDGLYSNLFGAYGNGLHTATFTAEASSAQGVDPDPGHDAVPPVTVPAFRRVLVEQFVAGGVPTPVPANTLSVSAARTPPSLVLAGPHLDQPWLSLKVTAGPGEPVRLTQLPVQIEGAGPQLGTVRLYSDDDGDGQVDSLDPLATASGGVFSDPLLVPAGTTQNVLVTVTLTPVGVTAFPWLALVVLVPFAFSGRRRVLAGLVVLWVGSFAVTGCGSEDSGTFTPTPTAPRGFTSRVTPADARAEGAFSGAPVTVQGATVEGASLSVR